MLSLPILVPYLAASLILLTAWALACLMYGVVRSGSSAWQTFGVGLVFLGGCGAATSVGVNLGVNRLDLDSCQEGTGGRNEHE